MRDIEELEADIIRFAKSHYRGHLTEVARRLKIGRSTLYRKLKQYGLDDGAAPTGRVGRGLKPARARANLDWKSPANALVIGAISADSRSPLYAMESPMWPEFDRRRCALRAAAFLVVLGAPLVIAPVPPSLAQEGTAAGPSSSTDGGFAAAALSASDFRLRGAEESSFARGHGKSASSGELVSAALARNQAPVRDKGRRAAKSMKAQLPRARRFRLLLPRRQPVSRMPRKSRAPPSPRRRKALSFPVSARPSVKASRPFTRAAASRLFGARTARRRRRRSRSSIGWRMREKKGSIPMITRPPRRLPLRRMQRIWRKPNGACRPR